MTLKFRPCSEFSVFRLFGHILPVELKTAAEKQCLFELRTRPLTIAVALTRLLLLTLASFKLVVGIKINIS